MYCIPVQIQNYFVHITFLAENQVITVLFLSQLFPHNVDPYKIKISITKPQMVYKMFEILINVYVLVLTPYNTPTH